MISESSITINDITQSSMISESYIIISEFSIMILQSHNYNDIT